MLTTHSQSRSCERLAHGFLAQILYRFSNTQSTMGQQIIGHGERLVHGLSAPYRDLAPGRLSGRLLQP